MPIAADRLTRQAEVADQISSSTVVDFATVRHSLSETPTHRFSIIDRMTAHLWAESGGALGYNRLAFEPAAEIDGTPGGEFLLIYPRDCAWSAWGIGCDAEGFTLWHAPRGVTIGRFRQMGDALARIPPVGRPMGDNHPSETDAALDRPPIR